MKFYRNWQPIKAITFDLDDTLYDNHPVIRKAENNLLEWLAKHLPQTTKLTSDDWLKFSKQVIESNPCLQSHVTEKRRAVLLLVALDCGLSKLKAKVLAEDALAYFLEQRSNFIVPEHSINLLANLSKHYPLVAITNGNVNADKLGLSAYFKAFLKAGFDGQAKPHHEMFTKAINFLAMPASQILHVGDHLITDVLGAKQAGLKACWLNNSPSNLRINKKATILPDVEISHIEQLQILLEI